MTTRILTTSSFFERHVRVATHGVAGLRFYRTVSGLSKACKRLPGVVLVHSRSVRGELDATLRAIHSANGAGGVVGVAADRPQLEEMLELSRHGISAYFNSFMALPHYTQLIRMLETGQTWFHPPLLTQALGVARKVVKTSGQSQDLAALTRREKEIALDVAQGLSNKRIANGRSISERTVKTHLTRIFKKLHVADRTSLAVRLSSH